MNKSWSGLGIASAIIGVVSASAWMTMAAERQSNARAASPAGLRVYINPETGEFEPPPATAGREAKLTAGLQETFSTTSNDLVETVGTTEAGGVTVDLQGRFHSAATVTVGADGKVVTHCDASVPHAR